MQDTFATVVETVTPLEPPTAEETTEATTEEVDPGRRPSAEDDRDDGRDRRRSPADVDEPRTTDGRVEAWAGARGTRRAQSFGAWVSEGAKHDLREGLAAGNGR